ncbi:MAG: ATP-binding protein [Caldimonas sp.]
MTDAASPATLEPLAADRSRHGPVPAWLFDPQWLNVIVANSAASVRYGYSEAEFLRLTMADIVCADEIGEFMRSIEPLSGQAGRIRSWRHRCRDGTVIAVESQTDPLEYRGGPALLAIVQPLDSASAGTVAVLADADAAIPTAADAGRRRAIGEIEAAEIKSRTRSEFLGRLSHELRTPLNAVIGFAELLTQQRSGLDLTQARYLDHILDAGRHLLALVDDVLDLQRIDAHRVALELRPVEVADFISTEMVLLTPLLEQQSLTMVNEVPSGLVVCADVKCLRQALLNIATNAIKFNRPGGIVRWSASVVRPGFAVLIITDTGFGISGEQLPRLFQPFDRLGMEHSSYKGNGLGLMIARGLLEQMGGRLDLHSRVGVGTQVLVELPLAEAHSLFGDLDSNAADSAQPISPVAPVAVPVPMQSNLMPTIRLLYVEDNRINAMLFEAVLGARPDIELRIATTGWEALDVVEEWIPDVLVLDANLPDINGIRLLRQLRDIESLKATPAFMCSADAMEEDVELARAAGFVDYWTKPVDFDKVLADLRRLTLATTGGDGR